MKLPTQDISTAAGNVCPVHMGGPKRSAGRRCWRLSTALDHYRRVQEAAVMNEFYAYDNHHRDRARVHRSECQWCNHGRGVQGGSSGANDQWHGPFSSAEDAYARVSHRADVSYCAYCRPQD